MTHPYHTIDAAFGLMQILHANFEMTNIRANYGCWTRHACEF